MSQGTIGPTKQPPRVGPSAFEFRTSERFVSPLWAQSLCATSSIYKSINSGVKGGPVTKWSTIRSNMKGPHIFNCPLHMRTLTIVLQTLNMQKDVNISYYFKYFKYAKG